MSLLAIMVLSIYNPQMKKALTIAGFDPTGGAGVQADLKVFHALGVYGLSVVSSLTAQNTREVRNIMPVLGEFVNRQLEVLLSDIVRRRQKQACSTANPMLMCLHILSESSR